MPATATEEDESVEAVFFKVEKFDAASGFIPAFVAVAVVVLGGGGKRFEVSLVL